MLWQDDLESIGSLCKRIRLSKHLERADIVQHFDLSMPTITRIENGNGAGRRSFEQYVQALQSDKASTPLTAQQAESLMRLYDLSRPQKVRQLESEIAALSLCDIKTASSQSNTPFRELIEAFRSQNRPALICDDLWFDHALNDALLQVFDMDPNSDYMYCWETWHSMAVKLRTKSPVHDAHDESDHVFPLTVQLFYAQSFRYLFTTQMRHLLNSLRTLSRANGLQFDQSWRQATTFGYSYSPSVLSNIPRRYTTNGEQQIHVEVQLVGTYPVTYSNGATVNFRLVAWNPLPGHGYTEERFRQVRQARSSQDIFYAVDYDREGCFHVNSWPQVRDYLMKSLD